MATYLPPRCPVISHTFSSGAQWPHLQQMVCGKYLSSFPSPSLTVPSPATGFSTAFPGITPHLLTLATNFNTPIYRDIILALGICSVSKASCSNILKNGPGSAITIVVGGAAESLSAHPGTADLTLKRRYLIFFRCSFLAKAGCR
jgi:hypothetical protein